MIFFLLTDIIGPIINPANSNNGSINLILTSKGQLFHYDAASIINCTDEETGGRVISINPIDKKIKWEKFFDYGHIDVACSMLRVNDECLIVIKNYSVISINATTGMLLFFFFSFIKIIIFYYCIKKIK